ncbi:MAG: glycoside hydrolase family 127 protein [Tepidisphaeraceae bacterium]
MTLAGAQAVMAENTKDYPVRPVPFTQVHLNDGFWTPRIETNRTVTIPFAFEQCEKNGRMYNFDRAAAAVRGEPVLDKKMMEFSFDDTDPYKVIEAPPTPWPSSRTRSLMPTSTS